MSNNELSNNKLYVFSLDGDNFRGSDPKGTGWETRDEALAAGREQAAILARLKESDQGPVWTGCKVECTADSFFPTPSDLLEWMADLAEGEVGPDAVGDWPDAGDVSEEAEEGSAGAQLSSFFKDTFYPFLETWFAEHDLAPTFWSLTDVVKHADDDGDGALQAT